MARLRPLYPIENVPTGSPSAADSTTHQGDALECAKKWITTELVASYSFPADWLRDRSNPFELPKSVEKDALAALALYTPNERPFLLIVLALPGKARAAEEALRSSLASSDTAAIGLATDGTSAGTIFLRRRFDSPKCDYIPDIEPYALKVAAPRAAHPLFAMNSKVRIDPADLVPLEERIEHLFFELHSHIRDIDGLHADAALDELCKLIYAKLYDEERAETEGTIRLWRQLYGTVEEFAAVTRGIYHDASEYDLRVFRLKIPQYERSRGVFAHQLRLSSPAIVKVMEEMQEYSLTRSEADVKGRAFQRVLTPAVRSGMGQYFTPEPVVSFIVNAVAPRVTDLILDPFCGSAHFLSKSLEFVRNSGHKPTSKAFHEFAFGKLHGIEKSDRMVRVAMTDMRLHGDGHSNIRCTDALLDFANYPDLEPASFDIVLTNPPFGSLLSAESISQLGKFHLAEGRNRLPLEILGLERCIQFLRPGGRMAIVLPDSMLTNKGTQYVRDWVHSVAKVRAIVSLPIETFSPFGANIKTSVLFVRKWDRGESHTKSHPVCLVRVDGVGYDANGRRNADSDLSAAAGVLSKFLESEGW